MVTCMYFIRKHRLIIWNLKCRQRSCSGYLWYFAAFRKFELPSESRQSVDSQHIIKGQIANTITHPKRKCHHQEVNVEPCKVLQSTLAEQHRCIEKLWSGTRYIAMFARRLMLWMLHKCFWPDSEFVRAEWVNEILLCENAISCCELIY